MPAEGSRAHATLRAGSGVKVALGSRAQDRGLHGARGVDELAEPGGRVAEEVGAGARLGHLASLCTPNIFTSVDCHEQAGPHNVQAAGHKPCISITGWKQ